MKLENNFIQKSLNVSNFKWSFKISDDILKILDLSQDLVLWKKSDKEVMVFTQDSFEFFVEWMKDKKWFNDAKLYYMKEWRQFGRKFLKLTSALELRDKNKLFLNWTNKNLEEKLKNLSDFSVTFYL